MPTSASGSKWCAVSSRTSRRHASTIDSPGSRCPAGWLSTRRPSIFSSTKRNRPSRSMTAATVMLGFQTAITFAFGSGRFSGVLPDEVGHALHASLDGLLGGSIGEADVLPFSRYAAAEVNVGEHRNAGLVEQTFAELLGIRGRDHAAGLSHIRPHVEGAA